ncbi:hypothetical protein KSX_93380 [Ktedonospora formicarum]|uniref:Uncharacterized protein n=1 Tax=Ktedonospora formicarum TaxID=2778364 RepID=A0A8J3MX84_9CHLR|nr:hypothetical protein KSX_93380 [Ktedonospora formicarum]
MWEWEYLRVDGILLDGEGCGGFGVYEPVKGREGAYGECGMFIGARAVSYWTLIQAGVLPQAPFLCACKWYSAEAAAAATTISRSSSD